MLALPRYTPRNDAAALTTEENESLDTALSALDGVWPTQHRLGLVPFMRDAEWDEDEVVQRARKLRRELDRLGTVSLDDVLPYLRPGECGRPPPCGVLMEDGHGECARDKRGNPVVVVYGGFECSADDAIRQLVFTNQRIQRYIGSQEIPHVTYVFDMKPRADLHGFHQLTNNLDVTFFRFASLFPQGFTVYVCAAPPRAAAAMRMLPTWMASNMKVSDSYDVLADVIDPSQMPPAWHTDGRFDFSVAKYVEALTAEHAND